MLDGVKAGAFGEHPAGKDALNLAIQLHLVNLDKRGGVRRLGRRSCVADPRRHLQSTELDRLVDGHLEMGDAPRDLVERGEHRDRILDDLGMRGIEREAGTQR
jgi:hypothetical protein